MVVISRYLSVGLGRRWALIAACMVILHVTISVVTDVSPVGMCVCPPPSDVQIGHPLEEDDSIRVFPLLP